MYDELIVRLRGVEEMLKVAQFEEAANLIEQATDAIEELQKAVNYHKFNSEFWEYKYNSLADEKWIPVAERLPEIEEDVLIAATVHTKKGDVRAVTGDFINTAGQWNGASCSWRYEVTHWMPLPEPPKEES